MLSARTMRAVFLAAAVFNVGGAALFAFPGSALGAFAGLPDEAPAVYKSLVALFVLLFAGMYAYLARSSVFDRSLVWIGAVGKLGAFLCVLALWAASQAPFRSVLLIGGDLIFATLFFAWLFSAPGPRELS